MSRAFRRTLSQIDRPDVLTPAALAGMAGRHRPAWGTRLTVETVTTVTPRAHPSATTASSNENPNQMSCDHQERMPTGVAGWSGGCDRRDAPGLLSPAFTEGLQTKRCLLRATISPDRTNWKLWSRSALRSREPMTLVPGCQFCDQPLLDTGLWKLATVPIAG